jgi:hypothetical protein
MQRPTQLRKERGALQSSRRVLARVLSERVRVRRSATSIKMTNTATDLGDRVDFTFRGGDGDSF